MVWQPVQRLSGDTSAKWARVLRAPTVVAALSLVCAIAVAAPAAARTVATAIDAGGDHTCALIDGGAVRCWGGNADGQLGDGTTTNRFTPVAVAAWAAGSWRSAPASTTRAR